MREVRSVGFPAHMKSFIPKFIPPLIILATCILIGVSNYSHGAYLLGWDNLQTELAPALAIKRAIFSGWQEYQSFGLVSGLAHAADFVRAVLVALLSWVLPNHLVRYITHILLLFTGGWGMYRLLCSFYTEDKDRQSIAHLFLVGALFYILNFGTIQIFSLPYDPFSWFFASLPWLLLVYRQTLLHTQQHRRKTLLLFFVTHLLATPAFYLQTLFVVYLLCVGGITLGYVLVTTSRHLELLRRGICLGVLILLINSFWLLPQAYFLRHGTTTVQQAKSNTLSTEETYYQNLEKGTVPNFLTFKGLYYDLYTTDDTYIFQEWKKHFESPLGRWAQLMVVALGLIGLITSNTPSKKFALPIYGMVALVLLSHTPMIAQLNGVLRHIPIIHQIFRSPFTKFIIPHALSASVFFTAGLVWISRRVSKSLPRAHSIFALGTGILLLAYSLPTFGGNFFSPTMRVRVPTNYFTLFDYFQTQPKNARIALLPDYAVWGWFKTRWGYDGSGFLWYGIEQPIVSRTFDVWSRTSESYFWQIQQAIATENSLALKNVLDQYRIDYLVVDHTLRPFDDAYNYADHDRLYHILETTDNITLDQKFGSLSVYKVRHAVPADTFISITTALPNTGPSVSVTNVDGAYTLFHDYMTDATRSFDTYFPFKNIFSQTDDPHKIWSLEETLTAFVARASLKNAIVNNATIVRASEYQAASYQEGSREPMAMPIQFTREQNGLRVSVPKVSVMNIPLEQAHTVPCAITTTSVHFDKTIGGVDVYSNNKTTGCIQIDLPAIDGQYGYLLKIHHQNITGRGLFFYMLDKTHGKAVIEDKLKTNVAYYILPGRANHLIEYAITFHNYSHQGFASENILNGIELYAFPTDILQNSYFASSDAPPHPPVAANTKVTFHKYSYFQYQVEQSGEKMDEGNAVLSLWQQYDDGWRAYSMPHEGQKGWLAKTKHLLSLSFPWFWGEKIEAHVMINNWANGWILPPKDTAADQPTETIIIYWPQYLQFMGFSILGIALVGILLYKEKKSLATERTALPPS